LKFAEACRRKKVIPMMQLSNESDRHLLDIAFSDPKCMSTSESDGESGVFYQTQHEWYSRKRNHLFSRADAKCTFSSKSARREKRRKLMDNQPDLPPDELLKEDKLWLIDDNYRPDFTTNEEE